MASSDESVNRSLTFGGEPNLQRMFRPLVTDVFQSLSSSPQRGDVRNREVLDSTSTLVMTSDRSPCWLERE